MRTALPNPSPPPAPPTAHRARPHPRGSWRARAPPPLRPHAGPPPPRSLGVGLAAGRTPAPCPQGPSRLICCSAPVSERLPLIWDRRPLCAWRVLHPRTSVPKERTCTKRCGPASREAPSCTPGPATHPTPALRLPGGALVPPPSGWGEPGRARTFGGRGGAHGRAGRADGCSSARTQVRSGCSRFLRPPPAPWEASGLGSDFGAEAGSLRAWARLFPLLAEGQVGRSGKSGPRPRKAGGAGTRVSSGDAGSGLGSEALPAEPHPPRPRGSPGQRAPRPPKLQARFWLPGAGDLHSPPQVGAAIATHLLPRPGACAAARVERLTWARCAAATAPATVAGAAPPSSRGEGGPNCPASSLRLVFKTVLRSAPWSRGRRAWGQRPNRPDQPGESRCPRNSSEIPPSPGAPGAVLPLLPSSLSSSRKPALTPAPKPYRCREGKTSVRHPALGSPRKTRGGRRLPHSGRFPITASVSQPAEGRRNRPEAQKLTQSSFIRENSAG